MNKPVPSSPEPNKPNGTPTLRVAEFLPPDNQSDVDAYAEANDRPLAWRDRPLVSYGILAVNVALFLAMFLLSRQHVNTETLFGAMDSDLIRQGQLQRFVTPIFLHGGLVHLVVNSLSLLWLGAQIETIYGGRRYFLIYLFAGITGNLASFYHGTSLSLGASGALFGLIGAGMVFPIRWRRFLLEKERNGILKQMLSVAVLNLGIGFSVPQIDNFAHMGGLVGGAFAALFFLPALLDDRPKNRARDAGLWLLVGAGLVLMGVCGFRQWKVAKRTPMPIVYTLTPYRPTPTSDWEIGIPEGWTKDKNFWQNEAGGTLDIADSLLPNEQKRVQEALQFVRTSNPTQMQLNGVLYLRAEKTEAKNTIDVSLFILNENRAVAVIFVCPKEKYALIRRDVLLTSSSFQSRLKPAVSAPGKVAPTPTPTPTVQK